MNLFKRLKCLFGFHSYYRAMAWAVNPKTGRKSCFWCGKDGEICERYKEKMNVE
jgi:hypothetical protein